MRDESKTIQDLVVVMEGALLDAQSHPHWYLSSHHGGRRRSEALKVVGRNGYYPKPRCCEACGERGRVLLRHHHQGWNSPTALLQVVWVCKQCHSTAHWKHRHTHCVPVELLHEDRQSATDRALMTAIASQAADLASARTGIPVTVVRDAAARFGIAPLSAIAGKSMYAPQEVWDGSTQAEG